GEFTPPEGERAAEGRERFEALLKFLKEKLPEVRDVRLSGRLTESAACLVGEAGGLPPHLERFLNRMGQPADPEATKRVLELNPDHPAVRAVRDLHEKNPLDARLEDYSRLLYEQAVIAEGSKVKDPAAFARRVNAL